MINWKLIRLPNSVDIHQTNWERIKKDKRRYRTIKYSNINQPMDPILGRDPIIHIHKPLRFHIHETYTLTLNYHQSIQASTPHLGCRCVKTVVAFFLSRNNGCPQGDN